MMFCLWEERTDESAHRDSWEAARERTTMKSLCLSLKGRECSDSRKQSGSASEMQFGRNGGEDGMGWEEEGAYESGKGQ